jgi:hypothetical protein
MAANEIHYNDIGTVLTITLKDGTSVVDISAATTYNIIFGKPDGTSVEQSGTFTTDGTDGKMYYTTVDGDLDQVGWWDIQAKIVDSSGTWRSDIGNFEVHANI